MDPENVVGRCLRLQQYTSVPGWSGLPDNLCEDCPRNLATRIRYPRAAKKTEASATNSDSSTPVVRPR